VLDQRQGVDLDAALVDEADREIRRHLAAEQARGLAYGAQQSVIANPRQEVLGGVDELGETFEWPQSPRWSERMVRMA
jgi:hypothetical protein